MPDTVTHFALGAENKTLSIQDQPFIGSGDWYENMDNNVFKGTGAPFIPLGGGGSKRQ